MRRVADSSRMAQSYLAAQMLRVRCAVLLFLALSWPSFSQDAGASSKSGPPLNAVRLSEILIKTPRPYDAAQVAEALRKAEEIRESIRQGKEFADLAKTSSQGPTAEEGGDLGYFSHGDVAPSIEDAVLRMKVGDVSDVIRTKQGFVILKVTGRGDSPGMKTAPAAAENPTEVPPELKPYVEMLVKAVKHKWYLLASFLPQRKIAYTGDLGIEFTVQRDGTVTAMRLLSDSGDRDLDKAAWEAVRQTSPFSPFPDAAKVDCVQVRIHFRYKQ